VVDAEVPYPVRVMLGQHPAPEVVIEDAASDAQQVPLIHLEGVMSPSAAPLGSSNRGSGVGLPLTQHPPSHLHPGSVTIDIAPSDDWQQQPASSLQRLSERVTQDDEVEVDREHTWDRPVAVVSAGGQQQQKQQGAQQLELLKRRLEELHTSRSNLSAMVQGTFQPNVLVRLCTSMRAVCMRYHSFVRVPNSLTHLFLNPCLNTAQLPSLSINITW
jgi:hypothetical protein